MYTSYTKRIYTSSNTHAFLYTLFSCWRAIYILKRMIGRGTCITVAATVSTQKQKKKIKFVHEVICYFWCNTYKAKRAAVTTIVESRQCAKQNWWKSRIHNKNYIGTFCDITKINANVLTVKYGVIRYVLFVFYVRGNFIYFGDFLRWLRAILIIFLICLTNIKL